MTLVRIPLLALLSATIAPLVAHRQDVVTFGTLLSCNDTRCLWADQSGISVTSDLMVTQFLQKEDMATTPNEFRSRLETHVDYLEQVHKHAARRNWTFPYSMGVNTRHLYHDGHRNLLPSHFVKQEHEATQRRQRRKNIKQRNLASSSLGIRETLNWCSMDNPRNQSICTNVKSQNQCGSCWAFAAADAIEMAVVVNADTSPQSLSPQQFLECSSRVMTSTFHYCWAEGGVEGSSWLLPKMIWGSRNDACNGGMTHAAFADAAQLHWSLLSELDLPYNEEETLQESTATLTNACNRSSTSAFASINGWEQVAGPLCDKSRNSIELLKLALQKQPISVAINSGGSFDEYKGGIYTCPNDGDFASSGDINHAIALVGYGSDDTTDFWILKNSYGMSWGEKGFLKLAMDSKINCGLNIFPVIPIGALAGLAHTDVDGGGVIKFIGLSPNSWILIGIAVAAVTFVLTIIGILYAHRQRNVFKNEL
ncbi:RxLR-like protein [Plasmopara halstedii]|uniref:RxLR-like protein n=1 Tax=Plasmopara halstedii TaxID=4781 RepID=A0A0N7L6C8_PLAHL|nr:RxLR-like protein [Plasmopara halstedii]CEG43915.1 RxLR-like protein [Plasmopara halstedii]|eukprot:XP_024580284.1 RxLR-like protein [Plasmopara halstedii]